MDYNQCLHCVHYNMRDVYCNKYLRGIEKIDNCDACPTVETKHGSQDYISREAAIIPSFRYQLANGEMSPPVVFVKTLLHSIPAADVREVKRGKWVWNDQSKLVCSLCGNVVAFVSHPKKKWEAGYFCPNCGADMREEQT